MEGQKYDVKSTQREVVELAFRFRPNGSSAIDNTLNIGHKRISVARTGTGEYTITLPDKYAQLLSAGFTVQLATPASGQVVIKSHDVSGAKTIVVQYYDATPTAADIANNAGNWVHCHLLLKNSTVNP